MAENSATAVIADKSKTNNEDRRAGSRECPEREYTIRLLARPNFQNLTAIVGDVSKSGLGLIMEQDLPAETLLCIQVPGQRNRRKTSLLSAVVIHAKSLGEGRWHIGCKFCTPLREEEKRALLGSSNNQVEIRQLIPPEGRRAWVRFQDAPRTQQQTSQTYRGFGITTGRLRDIDNESLRITLKRHFKVGSLVAIDLGNSARNPERPVQARVVDVAAQKGEWVVGCQFTSKLSDEELQMLVAV